MATFITLTQMEARLRGGGPAPRRNLPHGTGSLCRI